MLPAKAEELLEDKCLLPSPCRPAQSWGDAGHLEEGEAREAAAEPEA